MRGAHSTATRSTTSPRLPSITASCACSLVTQSRMRTDQVAQGAVEAYRSRNREIDGCIISGQRWTRLDETARLGLDSAASLLRSHRSSPTPASHPTATSEAGVTRRLAGLAAGFRSPAYADVLATSCACEQVSKMCRTAQYVRRPSWESPRASSQGSTTQHARSAAPDETLTSLVSWKVACPRRRREAMAAFLCASAHICTRTYACHQPFWGGCTGWQTGWSGIRSSAERA